MNKVSRIVLVIGFVAACCWSMLFAADQMQPKPAAGKNPEPGPQIQIDCQIKMTNQAGQSSVVASPKVLVLSGQPATITIGKENGESVEIQLTGTLR